MNCPFHGKHLVWFGSLATELVGVLVVPSQLVLLETGGNQCAIVLSARSPCYLEIEGQPVDWQACQRVKDLTPQ